MGTFRTRIPIGRIDFEELNGEKNNEVVISTCPNMNGNTWKEIFCYFEDRDMIKFAGDFCCDYKVDLKNKTIEEEHEGSWYMDSYKTKYIWHNDTLVPIRHVRLTLLHPESYPHRRGNNYEISYWENPILGYASSYELKFKEKYKKKKHKKYWDDFFDIE